MFDPDSPRSKYGPRLSARALLALRLLAFVAFVAAGWGVMVLLFTRDINGLWCVAASIPPAVAAFGIVKYSDYKTRRRMQL